MQELVMVTISLSLVIIIQWLFIFYIYSMFYKERKQLIDRIMAKSFIEYTNSELSLIDTMKPKKEIDAPKVRI
jgi:cbb3-type cytochrome oxidase subunit 3